MKDCTNLLPGRFTRSRTRFLATTEALETRALLSSMRAAVVAEIHIAAKAGGKGQSLNGTIQG